MHRPSLRQLLLQPPPPAFQNYSITYIITHFFLFPTTHCSLLRLIVRSGLDVPTFATGCLHACHHARAPGSGRWNCGQETSSKFYLNADLHVTFGDLLHAVKLRHVTDSFTSLPKEGVLRIFSPLKIRRLQPGANPRTWVPKASTLPLDHRSRFNDTLLTDEQAQPYDTSGQFIEQ